MKRFGLASVGMRLDLLVLSAQFAVLSAQFFMSSWI